MGIFTLSKIVCTRTFIALRHVTIRSVGCRMISYNSVIRMLCGSTQIHTALIVSFFAHACIVAVYTIKGNFSFVLALNLENKSKRLTLSPLAKRTSSKIESERKNTALDTLR